MDGYAVRMADVTRRERALERADAVAAGDALPGPLRPGKRSAS
jgi:molybdopterin biosynthesis enzyme